MKASNAIDAQSTINETLTYFSVHENSEGIAGLRTGKTFKIAGPASLLQVFTVVTYDVFYKTIASPAGPANISYC